MKLSLCVKSNMLTSFLLVIISFSNSFTDYSLDCKLFAGCSHTCPTATFTKCERCVAWEKMRPVNSSLFLLESWAVMSINRAKSGAEFSFLWGICKVIIYRVPPFLERFEQGRKTSWQGWKTIRAGLSMIVSWKQSTWVHFLSEFEFTTSEVSGFVSVKCLLLTLLLL